MAKIVIEVDTKTGQTNVQKLEDEFKGLDKQVEKSGKRIRKTSKVVAKSTDKMAISLKKVAAIGAGIFATSKLKQYSQQLVKIADDYTLIDAKIKLGTDSLEDFNKAYEDLYQISRDTGSQLTVNAQAFNKLALSGLDTSLDDLLRSQEILNKSMVVAGTTTAESAGFMLQYAQAMGSGVVNGDELRTMNEANSFLMNKIAKELGTNIAGLKEMGSVGTLTSERFFKALLKVGSEIDKQYGDIPVTVQRSLNSLSQVWKRIIADTNKTSGGTKGVADSVVELADVIDKNKGVISGFFTKIVDGATEAVASTLGQVGAYRAIFDTLTGDISFGQFFKLSEEDFRGYGEIREELTKINDEIERTQAGGTKEIKIIDNEEIFTTKTAINAVVKKLEDLRYSWKITNEAFAISPERQKWKKDTLAAIEEVIKKDEEFKKALENDLSSLEIEFLATPLLETKQVNTALEEVNAAFKASAEQWMATTGKNGEKVIKKYVESVAKANSEILSDTLDLADELSDLSRSGMTDKEAWKAVTSQIDQYRIKAEAAAKAGEWGKQLEFLERAKNLIGELDSDGVKIEVSAADVKRAKEVAKAAAKAAKAQSTSSTRQRAKEALADYKRLVKEKKSGGKVEKSAQDALNTKMKLTKQIGEEIISVKQANVEALKQEAEEFKSTFETYKAELKNVKEATNSVVTDTKAVGSTWVQVGGEWMEVSADMVKYVDSINASVLELDKNLNGLKLPEASGGSFPGRANGGPVNRGSTYMVGERGPELFSPLTSGNIIPNEQAMARNNTNREEVDMYIHLPTGETAKVTGSRNSLDTLKRGLSNEQRYAS